MFYLEALLMWIYPIYLVLLCLVVYLSIKLADLVDLLDKKTNISGAFIGGVLLAAVTSLPELFTSLSAVLIVKDPTLVIGNILGSDIFNLMILATYTVIFFKNFKNGQIAKWHLVSLLTLFVMYGLTCYALFVPTKYQPMLGSINALSFVILLVYIILIIFQPKESDEATEEEQTSMLSLKQIIILFIVCSLLLIGASIGITYMTDMISSRLPWLGGTIAGAILLGVATSLPEVISTFHLFKKRNFDAGYGNMIGSCTFNFSILALADFISWSNWNGPFINERGIFIATADSKQLALFGLIAISAITLMLVLKHFTKIFTKKMGFVVALILGLITLSAYLLVFIL